jgi:hypothetical protein
LYGSYPRFNSVLAYPEVGSFCNILTNVEHLLLAVANELQAREPSAKA